MRLRLARLAVGLALIGADSLSARLRDWQAAAPLPEPAADTPADSLPSAAETLRGLIGLGFLAADSTSRAVSAAASATRSVANAAAAPLRPVARSPLARPFRALAHSGQQRYARLIRAGLADEQRTRQLAGDVTGLLLEDMTGFAQDNPGVAELVDDQVARLLPALVADPTIQRLLERQLADWLAGLTTRSETLDPLVRALGDRYIAYLNENPDDVQALIQGQAMSMAGEARDSVRRITVTGDSFFEIIARGLLRRPPRPDAPAAQKKGSAMPIPPTGAPENPGEAAI
jgi:hypothetical protein